MGKYIRKAKTAGGVAVMDVSQASLGVRTRAKTLALQRQKSSTSPATVASAPASGDGSYLQLRSRRLEKPPLVMHHHDSKRHKQQQQQQQGCKKDNFGQNPNPNSNSRVRVGSEKKKKGEVGSQDTVQEDNGNDNIINYSNLNNDNNNESNDFGGVETSFGENVLDIEARESLSLAEKLSHSTYILYCLTSKTWLLIVLAVLGTSAS
ncbi:hypothetical protein ES332_D09G235200v1 [Gossypium tomentosum]|uniref:Uncharacterized protein n=1 Tax=Gossypium tomentosum TaxID=34277 RepID=A0A5D2JL48_GOSTO|nr:hypothetical protein ES332_D09G235200v1 [Gossypium tomentosum]